VQGNELTSLDVSSLSLLQELYLTNNQLSSIDVTHLPNLFALDLDLNQFTSLDITNNTGLVFVNISNQTGSGISTLDISNNLLLEIFSADSAGIHTLTTAPASDYTDAITFSFSGNSLADASDPTTLSFLNTFTNGWQDTQTNFVTPVVSTPTPRVSFAGGGLSFLQTLAFLQHTETHDTNPTNTSVVNDITTTYNRAFAHGLTTLPLAHARLSDTIERYEAAKMIVNYVKNVEKKTITHLPACNISLYADYSTFDTEMQTYIQSICDLGLMGRSNPKSKGLITVFRPFDYLGVDEFNIVIDRYLGNSQYSAATSNKRIDIMKFLMGTAGME